MLLGSGRVFRLIQYYADMVACASFIDLVKNKNDT